MDPAMDWRSQFEIANGYANAVTPQVALPDVAQPQQQDVYASPHANSAPVIPMAQGAHKGNGWDELSPEIQGKVNDLQKRYGSLHFTSGYRSPEHNRQVGGVPTSAHIKGTATDLVGSSRDMYEAAAYARRMGAKQVLVHNAGSGMHLHVQWQ